MYAKHMVPLPPAKFACEKQLIRQSLALSSVRTETMPSAAAAIFLCAQTNRQWLSGFSICKHKRLSEVRTVSVCVCVRIMMHYGMGLQREPPRLNCAALFLTGKVATHGCLISNKAINQLAFVIARKSFCIRPAKYTLPLTITRPRFPHY